MIAKSPTLALQTLVFAIGLTITQTATTYDCRAAPIAQNATSASSQPLFTPPSHQTLIAAADSSQSASTRSMGGWRLVESRNPRGGANAISIMHSADTSKSDIDLAGLMIRCSEKDPEVLIVLLQPIPLHAKPSVTLGMGNKETRYQTAVLPPGVTLLLPIDVALLITSARQSSEQLLLRIESARGMINGSITLTGIESAFGMLQAQCLTQ